MEELFATLQKDEAYRRILDRIDNGILIADKKGIIRYVNDSYSKLTHRSKEEVLEHSLDEIEGAQLPYTIESGEPKMYVYRESNYVTYTVNLYPIFKDKEIIGGLSVVIDETEVAKITEKERKAKTRAKLLANQLENLKGSVRYCFDDIIAVDQIAGETKRNAIRLAKSDMNVLLYGESGTGKEMYAQAMHLESERKSERFLAINCATLDNNLLESELFGYVDGAFTGARKTGKMGMFEEADRGTLFLDEISELDYKLQAKLLRVLQEDAIRPIGSSFEKKIDVRIIAATNKNLEKMVEEGRFRNDLYYRLTAVALNLPALRDCTGNIDPLLNKYIRLQSVKDKVNYFLSDETRKELLNYKWPGNVRELVNMIYVGAVLSEDGEIRYQDLPIKGKKNEDKSIRLDEKVTKDLSLAERVKKYEKEEIETLLNVYGSGLEGKQKVAEELQISLATLYNKLKDSKILE